MYPLLTQKALKLSRKVDNCTPLVNGLSNDNFQWKGLMPGLRKDHAVLSWDFRGTACHILLATLSNAFLPRLSG